ncbi:MAG: molecular chaperone DnaJ, partial [Spirochaetota bacterium]|nr:molecular chaperone DnaJ [Spirochaetota bacterium]
LNGKQIKLKIPAGSQTDKIFRMRGNGVPFLQGYGQGDLHVKIIVETPVNLSAKEKELLEEFAKLRNENVNPRPKSLYEKIKNSFS